MVRSPPKTASPNTPTLGTKFKHEFQQEMSHLQIATLSLAVFSYFMLFCMLNCSILSCMGTSQHPLSSHSYSEHFSKCLLVSYSLPVQTGAKRWVLSALWFAGLVKVNSVSLFRKGKHFSLPSSALRSQQEFEGKSICPIQQPIIFRNDSSFEE